MKVHIQELSEKLSGMYQIRLEHDTRVYKTSTSSKCSWNETLQVWCQQGVSHIHVELWHIPTVGSESLAAECSINIKRDVIDRNYPQNVMLMLRRRGKRVAMCSISFFRPGSDNDILSKLSDNISEDLRYRVAKAAQKPSKEAICLSQDLIIRSEALYGPDVAALQALATVSSTLFTFYVYIEKSISGVRSAWNSFCFQALFHAIVPRDPNLWNRFSNILFFKF